MHRPNSTIKQLIGVCIDCESTGDSSPKYIIANRCGYHYKAHRAEVCKKRNENRIINDDSKLEEQLQQSIDLAKFYSDAIKIVAADPICWNCGSRVTQVFYRHAVAHIFPKSIFPSVAAHPLNWLLLPAHCCHDKSHTIDSFSKMRVWDLACRRFKMFESSITENHKYLSLFKQAML